VQIVHAVKNSHYNKTFTVIHILLTAYHTDHRGICFLHHQADGIGCERRVHSAGERSSHILSIQMDVHLNVWHDETPEPFC